MSTNLKNLSAYLDAGQTLLAVESPPTERFNILEFLYPVASDRALQLFFWNFGYSRLQLVQLERDKISLTPTDFELTDGLSWLLSSEEPGIFVFEGAIAPAEPANGVFTPSQIALFSNIAYKLQMGGNHKQILICVEPYVELPSNLLPFVPILVNPYPTHEEVEQTCLQFCRDKFFPENNFTNFSKLATTCKGLPLGELEMALRRTAIDSNSLEDLIPAILAYKKNKLRGKGIEFISEPDVPDAAGLDLLNIYLEKAASLLRPEAREHNLSIPKGCIIWGPPGTGKSLSAKLAAKKMGVPLVAVDWTGLRGATGYESRRNLKDFLDLCDNLAQNSGLVVYFDDFDKGFAGFNSDSDGGVSRQMAGKLLTWMQERTSPVFVMATVNRLNFLPPELVRRFENNIFFVDLPHNGARYEIFKMHVAKYFPALELSEKDWWKLIRESYLLTPAEIASVVRKTAEEAFYQNTLRYPLEELNGKPLEVTVNDFLTQRHSFTPSMIREEDSILEIRNKASYATPASSPDTSRWAREPQPLFGAPPSDTM